MISVFSPEFRLAAACCVRPPPAGSERLRQQALLAGVDWQHFLRVVHRHRVTGLVYANLHPHGAQVPASILQTLAAAARRQALESLDRAAEAGRLVGQFEAAGIPVAVLKGSPLAILAFSDIALRHSKDIDLLIAPGHLVSATALLQAAGYARTLPHPSWTTPAHHATWLRLGKNFEYAHTVTGAPLDLHWRLTNNPCLSPAAFPLRDLQRVALSPNAVLPTLPSSVLLLYLCVHGSTHGWFRLKWLADVAALLDRSGPDAIPNLLAQAATTGLERPVNLTLELCQKLFATTCPDGLRLDRATRVLVRHAVGALTAGNGTLDLYHRPFGTTRLYLSNYLLQPTFRYRTEQLHIDFTRGSIPPSRLPLWLQPIPRALSWLWRKLRSGGRA